MKTLNFRNALCMYSIDSYKQSLCAKVDFVETFPLCCMEKSSMNVVLNICFCVPQKKSKS